MHYLPQILVLLLILHLIGASFKGPYKAASRLAFTLILIGWGMSIQAENSQSLVAYIAAMIALLGMLVALGIVLFRVYVHWFGPLLRGPDRSQK